VQGRATKDSPLYPVDQSSVLSRHVVECSLHVHLDPQSSSASHGCPSQKGGSPARKEVAEVPSARTIAVSMIGANPRRRFLLASLITTSFSVFAPSKVPVFQRTGFALLLSGTGYERHEATCFTSLTLGATFAVAVGS
jgi:hypothetical protein